MSFRARILVFAAVLSCAAVSSSGSPFLDLTGEQAPTQNTISQIIQSREGLLWIGTLGGLHIYDGITTKRIGRLAENQFLETEWVDFIFEDSLGRIWVAGATGELERLDTVRNIVAPYTQAWRSVLQTRPYAQVSGMVEGPRGSIWIATSQGLYRLDPLTSEIVPIDGTVFSIEKSPDVFSIEQLPDGNLALTTKSGLVCLGIDPETLDLSPVGWSTPLDHGRLTKLADGEVWTATGPGRIGRVHVVGDEMTLDEIELPAPLNDWTISLMAGDPNDELWLLTPRHGLARWKNGSGVTIFEQDGAIPDRQNFLHHLRVVTRDQSGVIWFGTTSHGIHFFSPSYSRFQSYGLANDPDRILTDDYLLGIAQSGQNSVRVISRQELFDVDLESGQATLVFRQEEAGEGYDSSRGFLSMLARNDDVLLGTVDGRLLRWDSHDRTATLISDHPVDSASHSPLWTIFEDIDGSVWACYQGDVRRYSKDLSRDLPIDSELQRLLDDATVRASHVDPDGTIWFGTLLEGLVRYDERENTLRTIFLNETESQPGIRGLLKQDNVLWIGTYRGLFRLEIAPETGEVVGRRHWSAKDGLPDGTIYDILPGSEGELWLSSNQGLVRFDPRTNHVRLFDSSDGLAANEFNGGAAIRTSDGWLTFGGIDGLSWFQSEHLYSNTTHPQQAISIKSYFTDTPQTFLRSTEYEIPWHAPHLDLSFAVLDYQQTGHNSILYRMTSMGDEWHTTRPGAVNHFPRLPEGRTVLEYKSSNNDGVWSEIETLTIHCPPPYWRSSTAKVGYFVLVALLICTAVLLELRRRTRKQLLIKRLTHADKLQAVGQLAGGMAHDFNNYLQVIVGESELLSMDLPVDHAGQESLTEIRKACDRAHSLARRMLSLSRNPEGSRTVQDMVAVVRDMQSLLNSIVGEGVELSMDFDDGSVPVLIDDKQVGHILTNLCINARDAMDHKGDVFVSIRRHHLQEKRAMQLGLPPGPYAWLTVTDTGPGVPENLKERIFEPFFTTKDQDKGTGLGLSTVFNIAQQHDGVIELDEGPGGGARFSVLLPISEDQIIEPKTESPKRTDLRGQGEVILLADDDPQVRRLMARTLSEAGYRVIETVDGSDAIERLREIKVVDAAVLDVIMPKKNGRDVHDFMRRMGLDVPVVFSTGYSASHLMHKGLDPTRTRILSKPYSSEELLRALKESLERVLVS